MTAPLDGNNASDIWQLMKLGVGHADHGTITGEGLQSLQDDPHVQGAENSMVDKIRKLPGYGERDFTVSNGQISEDFTANGPSGNFAIGLITGNPAFLMVHTGNLSATNTKVSADGTISTTWKVNDSFDYLPAWGNHTRSGFNYWAYNIGATISYPIYYGLLNAEDQFPTTASWDDTIPDDEYNNRGR